MDGCLNAKKTNCGFDLCPKEFKYLSNPRLLEQVFTNHTAGLKSIIGTGLAELVQEAKV